MSRKPVNSFTVKILPKLHLLRPYSPEIKWNLKICVSADQACIHFEKSQGIQVKSGEILTPNISEPSKKKAGSHYKSGCWLKYRHRNTFLGRQQPQRARTWEMGAFNSVEIRNRKRKKAPLKSTFSFQKFPLSRFFNYLVSDQVINRINRLVIHEIPSFSIHQSPIKLQQEDDEVSYPVVGRINRFLIHEIPSIPIHQSPVQVELEFSTTHQIWFITHGKK